MRKIRVNWTISPETIGILERVRTQAKKAERRDISISELVDMSIKKALVDPIIDLRARAKIKAQELHQIQEQIQFLEEQATESNKIPQWVD